MKLTQEDLVEIAQKAGTLEELLAHCTNRKGSSQETHTDGLTVPHISGLKVPHTGGLTEPDNGTDELWEQWQAVFKGNDSDAQFKKRLLWDELDPHKVRNVLKKPRDIFKNNQLPGWTTTLRQLTDFLDTVPYSHKDKQYLFLNPEHPIPFQELLSYFVLFARDQLRQRSGAAYTILADAPHIVLERCLLQILSGIGNMTLQLEFSLHRIKKQSGFNMPGLPNVTLNDGVYDDFIQTLLKAPAHTGNGEEQGLVGFFKEYAVLAVLISQAIESWIECSLKFIERLKTDWQKIRNTFQIKDETCKVLLLKPYLSDLHNGGYSVMAFTLSSGISLVYKPRDVAVETAYYDLLEWFNNKKIELPFKTLAVLNKNTHGWVEYIGPKMCDSQKDRANYYLRAGRILFILYGLYGKDFHCENIIAGKDQPVVVDLETLFHPEPCDPLQFQKKTAIRKQSISDQQFTNSVLRTDFLPQQNFDYYDMDFDISGLAALSKQRTSFMVPDWKNINTDDMDYGLSPYHLDNFYNIPRGENEQTSPQNYVEHIIAGFKALFQILKMNRREFLSATGPLARFKSLKTRFLFRPSKVYGSLMYKCLQPDFLRDGLARSFQFEALYRKALSKQEKPKWWALIKEEKKALHKMNVPYFSTKTDSDILETSGAGPCIAESGYSLASARLKEIDEEDLSEQISLISACLKISG
ncbi:MAG: type 2 lantipeptide synthetase LanM [bacterium]|nr:type 2 lantipeptide synthetase LanM [bacterium]